MNKLSFLAAAGLLLASSGVFSASVPNNFTVSMNFTGACSVQTAASNFSFTYAAFDTAKTGSTSTIFQCSRGLTPTFNFDNTGAGQTGSAAAALGSGITAEGVIQGVRYTLSGSSTQSTVGTAASAGANGTGGSDGSADQYTVTIDANVAAGQAGNGTGGSGTQTRTLYISY